MRESTGKGEARMEKSCSVWLGEYLMSEGAVLCDEVRKQARSQGYRSSDLKKARKELQVKTFHQFDDDGATDNWFWYLEV